MAKKKDTSALREERSGKAYGKERIKILCERLREENQSKIKSVWALSFTLQWIGLEGKDLRDASLELRTCVWPEVY